MIEQVIKSFRPGAKIRIDDVRFAAAVDGIDLSQYTGLQLAGMLKEFCDPVVEEGNHFSYWIRKVEA